MPSKSLSFALAFLLLGSLASAAEPVSEYETFLTLAQEKYAEGDYNASRDLCEEILKRAPRMAKASEILNRTKRQLATLAKEAYLQGIEAERMTQIDTAKSYWNRALNYARPEDPFHREIASKLEKYR